MAYKFIKYRTEYPNPEMSFTSGWVFAPQSLSDVYDFFERFTIPALNGEMDDFWHEFSKKFLHGDAAGDTEALNEHMCSVGGFTTAAWMTAKSAGIAPVYVSRNMAFDLLKNRIKYFSEGGHVFYGKDGLRNIAMDSRYSTIVDECYTDTIEFPDFKRPTLADVKYTMWDGGRHWYAKVEKLDVVVDGVQKWNSKSETVAAAKRFIEETWPVK